MKKAKETVKTHIGSLRAIWAWTEDRHWWQVAHTESGLEAWVYADNASQAKNKAIRQWAKHLERQQHE